MADKNNKIKLLNKEVEKYYNDTLQLYNFFYSNDALHYGFWHKDTKKLSDAIKNTNIFVAELLDLNKDDYVLDAGCGVGGTSLFMAEKFKAKITGITLSAKQLIQAKRKAAKKKLDKLVNFEKMDFNKTAFQNETFTKIFGLESVCYAYDKLDFLKEAYRILKVGGKIVVADGFLSKRQLTEEEDVIYKKCLLGWKVDNLSHRDDFFKYLEKAGF
jgi:cyclopropane fatty-acyl-phospholipid synthase-like methyltransferase